MKKLIFCQLILLMLFALTASGQSGDNPELLKMYEADQGARQMENTDWGQLARADSARNVRVREMINQGKISSANDYYRSALIFQHGEDSLSYGMAVHQMRQAIALDTSIDKWLLAAAIDRDLMSRNKPQIYGTQFTKTGRDGKWVIYKMDTTQITDAERKKYHVPSLAAQKVQEHNMNLVPLSSYYSRSNAIEGTLKLMRSERKKGGHATYNVSEDEINSFGYQLMQAKKYSEALKVFKLNVALSPGSFNAFDSYGECLLRLGRTSEGIKAYQRSLALNPGNKHAGSVLAKHATK